MFETVVALAAWMAVLALGAAMASGALAASSPTVVTGSATSIGQSSALLHGTVNPNGSSTTYYFQWGLTNSYGVTGKAHSAGAGVKAVAVKDTATNLLPGTTYHYRLVASSRFGSAGGADHTFKTAGHPPPGVATGPATGISANGANLTGVVNPNGQATTYYFQFDTGTNYRFKTSEATLPAGTAPISVSTGMPPLQAGVIYHYRVVATHGGNTTQVGADAIFMTFPSPPPVPKVFVRSQPHRLGHRPFTVATLGSVTHPSWMPAQFACSGNVLIRYMHKRRVIATTFVPLQPNCTYASLITFARKHKPLTVKVRYLGNGYLASSQTVGPVLRFT
jgi:hypothetical protein